MRQYEEHEEEYEEYEEENILEFNLICFGRLLQKHIGHDLGDLEGLFMHFELTSKQCEYFYVGEVHYYITTSFNEATEKTIVKEGETKIDNGYIQLPGMDLMVDIETYFTRI